MVYATDLKSVALTGLRVRVPPLAPLFIEVSIMSISLFIALFVGGGLVNILLT